MRRLAAALAAASFGLANAAHAAPALTFTTLGTNSGPIPRADRSEPANLVRYGDQAILVDVGDGASEQLAKAGVPLRAVQTLIISHLHFDHTGGLFGFLSLRFQSRQNAPLTIYGPPGTQEMVTRLFAAMAPGEKAATTMGPSLYGAPDAGVKVIEVTDGAAFAVGEVKVSAVENTHFQTLGPPGPGRPVSLSYRFDAPGRSVLYTGDTGPSDKVAALCKGSDLLVSEIMDPALAVAKIIKAYPNAPPAAAKAVEAHFRTEHMAPTEVGRLAAACGVKLAVGTHDALERDELKGAAKDVASAYKGRFVFAEDLQTF